MNLVTGATGLLGTHLMLELLMRGEKVRGLKRADSDLTALKNVFEFYDSSSLLQKIEWVEGDVLDVTSLQDALVNCESVYHCAAVVSYHRRDRSAMYKTNIEGTSNVLNASLEAGIRKFCHVSSIAAIGREFNESRLNEDSPWVESLLNTHYGITKHLSEMEVWRAIQEGLSAVIVNPGFIIGPGDHDKSSTSIFRKIKEGVPAYPRGGTGFVAATDVARAMVDLCQSSISNERYIIVAENLAMKDLFIGISKAMGARIPKVEATPFLLQLARIAEAIKELITGKKALVTRETVRNTSMRFYYDTTKIEEAIDMTYRPIPEVVTQTASFISRYYH